MPHKCLNVLVLILVAVMLAGGKPAWGQEADPGTWLRRLSSDTARINHLVRASLQQQNDPDSAISLLRQAFTVSTSIAYPDGCARSLLGIGTQYFNKGDLEQSKAFFRQAYPYCWNARFARQELLLSWCNNMASPYALQGRYDTAVHFYYKALNYLMAAPRPDSMLSTVILCNLGTVWQRSAQYRQALFYTRKGLQLAMQTRDTNRIADCYQNIGLILEGMGRTAEVLPWLHAARAFHLKKKNYLNAQMDCCAIAMHYTNGRQHDSALMYYNEGLELSRQTTVRPLHEIFVGLGYAYLQTNDYDRADYYLRQALDRSLEQAHTGDLTFIYSGLADVYAAQHRYREAEEYRRRYIRVQDSLVNAEKILSANTLEVRYRTAEKDKEIVQAQLQLALRDSQLKQKNFWMGSAAGGAVLLLAALFGISRSYRRKRKLERQQWLNLQQGQEIRQLKSMMDGEEKERTRIARELHDGIMVQLASIKMKLRKAILSRSSESQEDLSGVLQQLDTTTAELRRTAHNLMPDMLLEGGLTDALFYCCNNLQKGTDLSIDFQHYGVLPPLTQEAQLYIYRIVQELLQNIIKHAHAGKALVQMNYHAPLLSFTVEDNGMGYDRQLTEPGMGLKNVYSRLQALKGSIDVKSGKFGTTVYIELNVIPFLLPKTDAYAHPDSYS